MLLLTASLSRKGAFCPEFENHVRSVGLVLTCGKSDGKPASYLKPLLFAFLCYGYGAALHINALADSSDIQLTRYLLRKKRISNGKTVRHIAELDKADPGAPEVSSAEVTPYFYGMLKPGDSVCLAIRRGALRIQWFSAGPCPKYMLNP
jgi:hypothetical protein